MGLPRIKSPGSYQGKSAVLNHLALQHAAGWLPKFPCQAVDTPTASPTLPLLKAQNWHLYVQMLQYQHGTRHGAEDAMLTC
jgi:hypothetical protein